MSKNKLSIFCFIIGITTISISYLSADECVDNVADTYANIGGCAGAAALGFNCATEAYAAECPVTCNTCPGECGNNKCEWDEKSVDCPADCPVCEGSPICINIINVDADAAGEGTFDIHMTNQPGCSYCTDQSGYSTKESCETLGNTGEGATWTFSTTIDETTCVDDTSGVYFDGNVLGFQFVMSNSSMTTTTEAVIGGNAYDLEYTLNSNPDWEESYAAESWSGIMLIGFSLTGATIPAGEGVLATVEFTGYTSNDQVCFLDNICESSGGVWTLEGEGACINTISDVSGVELDTDWGDCKCPIGGCCVGSARDCAGVCDGNAEEDICGTCEGDITDQVNCEMAIFQIGSNFPEEFSISQNYPNPFNPVTSISFDVAIMDEISLIVYDLLGKEVITLASGTFMPGRYLVNWDAVNNYGDAIASGMYIYRYISSDKAIIRKMLYLK